MVLGALLEKLVFFDEVSVRPGAADRKSLSGWWRNRSTSGVSLSERGGMGEIILQGVKNE